MANVPSRVRLPDAYAAALPRLRGELEQQRSSRTAQLAELSHSVAGDTGEDGTRDEVSEARAIKIRQLLAEIEGALTRMDQGDYGVCQVCSTPIPLERLEIMPHARYCVTCGQSARDR